MIAVLDVTVLQAVLAGLGAAFSWGLGCLLFDRAQSRPPAAVGYGVEPPSAAGMNLFKNTVAIVVFFGATQILGMSMPGPSAWPFLFLSGVVGFAIGDSMYFAAFPKAGVQLTAMIGNLTPPLAGLLAWGFLGETFSLAALGWMGVVILGISLVVLDPVGAPRKGLPVEKGQRLVGIGLAFGSAVSQAAGIVMAYSVFKEVGILPGTVLRLAGGISLALPIAMFVGWLHGAEPKAHRRSFAGALAGLGEVVRPLHSRVLFGMLIVPTIVATIISLPMHSYAVREAPSHLSSLVLATSPLFILPLGRLFGARHGVLSVVGTLVGFGGLAGVLLS